MDKLMELTTKQKLRTLRKTYPNNTFYKSLETQLDRFDRLTEKQLECLNVAYRDSRSKKPTNNKRIKDFVSRHESNFFKFKGKLIYDMVDGPEVTELKVKDSILETIKELLDENIPMEDRKKLGSIRLKYINRSILEESDEEFLDSLEEQYL